MEPSRPRRDPASTPEPMFARRIDCASGPDPRPGHDAPTEARASGSRRAPGEEAE